MLTSKPPFQSTTTDEIYRRARERDYEWPSIDDSSRVISPQIKDLVATMLQEADNRPAPDIVIQHPFFTSGYMPSEAEMSSRLRELPPDRQEFYSTRMDSATLERSNQNFLTMCRECCVGPWDQKQLVHTQVWKEMAAEEKAGLTPAIPLAEGIVYRPFDEWLQEQSDTKARLQAAASGFSAEPRHPTAMSKQPPQSFAAQQRAQSRPSTVSGPPKPRPQASSAEPPLSASQSTRVRPRKALPTRETAIKDLPVMPKKALEKQAEPSISKSESAGRVAQKISAVTAATSSSSTLHKQQNSKTISTTSLFSSEERQTTISDTHPDMILERLRKLQVELERALNSRTMAVVSAKTTTPPHPHVVVKWVDYTNKFGLGYVLNDGSVGCILRDIPTTDGSKTAMLPPAGIFIRGAERHINRRDDKTYAERAQPIPMTEPIKFFENNGEAGLSEVLVSPEHFRVPINEDGTAGKMTPGRDLHQHRKRERIILWKKFANYMMAYGRDGDVPAEDTAATSPMSPGNKGTPAELVTFYQRFGDVGCWAYCDGHLQFNFPDHTKIVIDSTGTWCHFWHLPKEAAQKLADEGTIEGTALDERAMLSYPLQTLLNFQTKPTAYRSTRTTATTRRRPEIDPELQDIPATNDFRRKIEFIKNVVKEWVVNGGLGNSNMKRETRLRWTGHREIVHSTAPVKHVWVTIGARWGDQRLTTLVDPRRPWDLGEDLESSSR